MSDYRFISINYDVQKYRKNFLKRKNINKYKKVSKGTPLVIDKLLNCFDRKIKGIEIFTEDVKRQYFEGLEVYFDAYYWDTFQPRFSKTYHYNAYIIDMMSVYGYYNYKNYALTFKEFVRSGMLAYYKKQFNAKKQVL
jgi:hypothetical protein